jgi:hypothetical protein
MNRARRTVSDVGSCFDAGSQGHLDDSLFALCSCPFRLGDPKPVRRSKFAVPASLEHCENLVNLLLARKQLTLPPRTRADIQRLLYLTYPVTLPAAGLRADALAYSLWETRWRGVGTVQQMSIPALHVQTLTVKWWVSLPEWLRFGSAAHLLRVLSSCVDNLFRFWQCVVEPSLADEPMGRKAEARFHNIDGGTSNEQVWTNTSTVDQAYMSTFCHLPAVAFARAAQCLLLFGTPMPSHRRVAITGICDFHMRIFRYRPRR